MEAEITAEISQEPTQEQAIAKVQGELFNTLPEDLYIPPDALQVFLETFEGPLDLLLYLIKRQNLDILDIPIAKITKQYVDYIELMHDMRIELAADYLVMAAMLAEIKSRMLLPRPVVEDDEEDPRAELVRRLQEYEQFKEAAEKIDELPRQGRDVHTANALAPEIEIERPLPDVSLKELLLAFNDVLQRIEHNRHHHIEREPLSIRERMTIVLRELKQHEFVKFEDLFTVEEGRMGVVVSFIAILELLKQSLIDIVQQEPLMPIHVKAANS